MTIESYLIKKSQLECKLSTLEILYLLFLILLFENSIHVYNWFNHIHPSSLPSPGWREFCPVLSSAQSLGDQHLLIRQRTNGKIVYINLRTDIFDISITVLCPDWNKTWGQRNQHLTNTSKTFTHCTQTLCLHVCTCKYAYNMYTSHTYMKRIENNI